MELIIKICKKGVTDCNTDNYEVSLDNLLNTRLIKDVPEAPGNEDVRYTGYELAEFSIDVIYSFGNIKLYILFI